MRLHTLLLSSLALMSLSACGNAEQNTAADTVDTQAVVETSGHQGMDHGSHEMDGAKDGIGHATGTIRSVGAQGDFLTINHGPFEGGVEMGAMTMGFDAMGDVDLSGFSEGDQVAFMVKQGRDGSYRIMAICNTDSDGADCLDGMMDH